MTRRRELRNHANCDSIRVDWRPFAVPSVCARTDATTIPQPHDDDVAQKERTLRKWPNDARKNRMTRRS
ncbi:MAG: hypothetical protein CMJ48_03040 [Planctomycetaceae bacterium]|nr:hypothetical protein [Planctomycetaceae bacterium]